MHTRGRAMQQEKAGMPAEGWSVRRKHAYPRKGDAAGESRHARRRAIREERQVCPGIATGAGQGKDVRKRTEAFR